MSIEHKESWMNSNTPIKKFFDLNNIAFSHKNCNYSQGMNTIHICPHCSCIGKGNTMFRHHFDNCKYRGLA
jgi:hypothetical protein